MHRVVLEVENDDGRLIMEIQGPGSAQGPKRIAKDRPVQLGKVASAAASGLGDSVAISPAARLRGALALVPEVRMERVERLRAEIAAGTYESPKKLEVAVDRLLKDLTGA